MNVDEYHLANERAAKHLRTVQALVNEQAEDEGLWFQADTATEAYLQQELRRLHDAIEVVGGIPMTEKGANDGPL
jgi:hypothetical protein